MDRLIKQSSSPTLYSYVVAYDYGNAPNPDFNCCTLAICKPVIRQCAQIGDIILGLSPKRYGNYIIYCMVIDEIIDWQNYYLRCKNSLDLANRIPTDKNHNGDCIWIHQSNNDYVLLESKSGHTENNRYSDIESGQRVLIGRNYWYFGSNSPAHQIYLPNNYLSIGRGHRKTTDKTLIDEFIAFFNQALSERNILTFGKHGDYWE